jgi:hypothetical protein
LAFSEVNLPKCKAGKSLVNLSIEKLGTMMSGFIFEMPAPKKSGVVGSGNKE